MKRLSEDYLLGVLLDYQRKHGSLPTEVAKCYLLAGDALCQFISPKWTMANVFGVTGVEAFLRPRPAVASDAFRHADRVIALAEILFNLQGVDGIAGRAKQLRSGSVETTVAELEGAKLLYRSGRSFRFVTTSGRSGADFDLALVLSDSSAAACELKCKIETTRPSLGTLFDTLEHASSQLPENEPTIIFVKVPEAWSNDPAVPAVASQALEQAARLSNAPGLVVFHWEKWMPLASGGMARAVFYRPEPNPEAPRFHSDLLKLLEPTGAWRYFVDMVRPRSLA